MKAISILQPWAWAIAHGSKRIENRSRRTHYRGEVLLHVGKSRRCVDKINLKGFPGADQVDFGCLIAIFKIVDCLPLAEVRCDPWAVGPWCWIIEDVRLLPTPIDWPGQQNFFEVPDSVVESASKKTKQLSLF